MSLVIFLLSLYFLRSLLRTLCLLIHKTFCGILASLVPFLLPWPVCLPILILNKAFILAYPFSLLRGIFVLLRLSACELVFSWSNHPWRAFWCSFLNKINDHNPLLELARATSEVSLGSIQTLFLPHLSTDAANLFCNLRNAISVKLINDIYLIYFPIY